MAGLYIHVPFCRSRCIYCGFYSTTLSGMQQRYVDALISELNMRTEHDGQHWNTIYIGGGTPSTLEPQLLHRLFDAIDYSKAKEVTLECNPDDVTAEFAKSIARLPVNRVSMGVQTFNDQRLSFIRRRHNAKEAKQAVAQLREAGISNISIDLMFGFPGETLEEWNQDISEALALGVPHLSAYSLMFEEGTALYKMLEQGNIEETDEETSRLMYYTLKDKLEAAGYVHYEISNYSKPGFEALHNSSYWNGTPYMGIGAAAHSFDGKDRQWNVEDLNIYINKVEQGCLPAEKEILNDKERYNDMVMLSLRTRKGIDMTLLEKTFGNDMAEYCRRCASPFLRQHLLKESGHQHISLTREGLYVSDMVMSEMMWV